MSDGEAWNLLLRWRAAYKVLARITDTSDPEYAPALAAYEPLNHAAMALLDAFLEAQ